jgi:hypothetical protein
MQRTTTIIAALCLLTGVLGQAGCSRSSDVKALSNRVEPLRVCRPDGDVESITIAEAMAYHHAHEDHDTHTATGDHSETQHEDEICVGVATGYQAIRYAAGILFPGETPKASDVELSVAATMAGLWDIMDLYAGRELTRPSVKQETMSLESFVFTARRVSTGKTLVFRLREGLIAPEFFELKNRGVSCDDDALTTLKKRAALKVLSAPPPECFEMCQ